MSTLGEVERAQHRVAVKAEGVTHDGVPVALLDVTFEYGDWTGWAWETAALRVTFADGKKSRWEKGYGDGKWVGDQHPPSDLMALVKPLKPTDEPGAAVSTDQPPAEIEAALDQAAEQLGVSLSQTLTEALITATRSAYQAGLLAGQAKALDGVVAPASGKPMKWNGTVWETLD